jgi:hypothetical protein
MPSTSNIFSLQVEWEYYYIATLRAGGGFMIDDDESN